MGLNLDYWRVICVNVGVNIGLPRFTVKIGQRKISTINRGKR